LVDLDSAVRSIHFCHPDFIGAELNDSLSDTFHVGLLGWLDHDRRDRGGIVFLGEFDKWIPVIPICGDGRLRPLAGRYGAAR